MGKFDLFARTALITGGTDGIGLALAPMRRAAVYCASKSGLRAFTRALRYQCEDAFPNVHVMEALPPLVDTALAVDIPYSKITPEECAASILKALICRRSEVCVGASQQLKTLTRRSTNKAYALMRDR